MSEIREIVEALGIEIADERGDEIQALCPMHEQRTGKVDHNPSWWINSETGQSICFSCGYSAGLRGLVADVLGAETGFGLPDWDAVDEWLSDYRDALESARRKFEARNDGWQGGNVFAPVAMTEARLAVFDSPPQWALDARSLHHNAASHYGVRWDEAEKSWITPLRDPETHDLMGWQAKGQGHRLFRNNPPGIQKSQTLFGIEVWEGPRMIVVESPLDCVRLRTVGIDGAVSTFGASISERQIQLIMRADEIILAFDRDDAGYAALEKFYEASLKKGIDFKQFAYSRTDSDAKDPGDMTDAEITKGIHHALHSIWGIDQLRKA